MIGVGLFAQKRVKTSGVSWDATTMIHTASSLSHRTPSFPAQVSASVGVSPFHAAGTRLAVTVPHFSTFVCQRLKIPQSDQLFCASAEFFTFKLCTIKTPTIAKIKNKKRFDLVWFNKNNKSATSPLYCLLSRYRVSWDTAASCRQD